MAKSILHFEQATPGLPLCNPAEAGERHAQAVIDQCGIRSKLLAVRGKRMDRTLFAESAAALL